MRPRTSLRPGARGWRVLAIAGVLLAAGLAPVAAQAQLVDLSTNWKTKQGLPTYCEDQKQARFVVQGPGALTVNLTLKPYRSAGKSAYIPIHYTQYRPDGTNTGWDSNNPPVPGNQGAHWFVAGREVGNFVEGAPLELRQTFLVDAKRYDLGVVLGAPCQSFGGGGFAQFAQAQHLVITFAGSGGQTATAPTGATAVTAAPRPLFNNGNDAAVMNGPTRQTSFSLAAPTRITKITDYHWNGGRGAAAGDISLRGADGRIYGPWRASLQGQAYWVATPNTLLPAGRYVVVDSDPATWSQNAGSGGAGMSWAEGVAP